MSKYKKLFEESQNHIETQNKLIAELTGHKVQLEECNRIMKALQAENQRFLEENNRFMEQISAVKAEIDRKNVFINQLKKEITDLNDTSRLTGKCDGCRYKGVNVQKCGSCTRNPRAIDKYSMSDTVNKEISAPK